MPETEKGGGDAIEEFIERHLADAADAIVEEDVARTAASERLKGYVEPPPPAPTPPPRGPPPRPRGRPGGCPPRRRRRAPRRRRPPKSRRPRRPPRPRVRRTHSLPTKRATRPPTPAPRHRMTRRATSRRGGPRSA